MYMINNIRTLFYPYIFLKIKAELLNEKPNHLMGLDAVWGRFSVNPKRDIAQNFAGQKLVKRFGQLLRIVDPR